jgi:D-alanine-D-alanine ligase
VVSKLRIGLLFGGRSVEHAVSIASATSILGALDPARYEISLVAIDEDGRWHLGAPALPPQATVKGEEVSLPAVPSEHTIVSAAGSAVERAVNLDVVFPIVHGQGGEDGALQGLLELACVPYVGSGVLGSAVQMDKDVAKRLLAAAGLPVVPWQLVRQPELRRDSTAVAERVLAGLPLPVFVKPANLGSSVGISKVDTADALVSALEEAARYDEKILVEQGIQARDVEVALLGNDPVEASVPGEIRTPHDFYDYDAKYRDGATELLVPAPVSDAEARRLQHLACEAFRVLEGSGLGRVDFFLERGTGAIFVNEVNSLPGFTEGSMYPRLWAASGIPYPALIDRLIELALERHRARASLETHYRPDPGRAGSTS